MGIRPLDDRFKEILEAVASTLRPLAFRRRGPTFRLRRGDMCGFINLQRSVASTREGIRFTVNVGVAHRHLPFPGGTSFEKSGVWDAHVHDRLGPLSPHGQDHWWTLDAATDLPCLAAEVVREIETYALPHLESLMTPEALRAWWEIRCAAGRASKHEIFLLARLKAALESSSTGRDADG